MGRNDLNAQVFAKRNYYYIRLAYYIEGKRKLKDVSTGIQVGNPNSRAGRRAKSEAEMKRAEVLRTFRIPSHDSKTLAGQAFADTVRTWLERQRGSKSPSTIAGYTYCANDVILYFTEICPVRTLDLTSDMIEDYEAWERMRRQPTYTGTYAVRPKFADGSGVENTIKHRTTLIRSVLQYAKRAAIVVRNVASTRDCEVELPKPMRHVFPVLTEQESQTLVRATKHAPLWFRLVVLLAMLFGLRRSEICALCEQDIDWESGIVTIRRTITQQTIDGKNVIISRPFTKNRRPKTFKLVQPVRDALREIIAEHKKNEVVFGTSYCHDWDGYVIRYPDGRLISPNMITNRFAAFSKDAGLKITRLHDLRHSCATILLAMGCDIKTVQEIMGHADLSSTMEYLHALPHRKEAALSGICNAVMVETDGTKEEIDGKTDGTVGKM